MIIIGNVHAEERVALVVGNGNYHEQALSSPVNDAHDMASFLKKCNFDVSLVIDADQATLEKAIQAFGYKLQTSNKVGLFYYSGHGVQYGGSNFLIPIGSIPNISNPSHLRYKAVNAGYVLGVMEGAKNKLNIVIFDSCRDNPFKSFSKNMQKGLTRMPSAEGTIIAYATAPGNIALDGLGRNSPYTQYLLEMMQEPNLPIEFMLKKVRTKVKAKTQGTQTPWYEASIDGDFYFVRKQQRTPSSVRASHILIQVYPDDSQKEKKLAREKIENILMQAKAGENFAELARKYSEGPSSINEGDLGFFSRDMMVKPFEDAAFSLMKGEISDVVETQFGYHIIKVTDQKFQK